MVFILHRLPPFPSFVSFLPADCLRSFTHLERLVESEWYYCLNCKSRQPSTKQLTLHTLPNVSLVPHQPPLLLPISLGGEGGPVAPDK